MGYPLAGPLFEFEEGPARRGFVDQSPSAESDYHPKNLNVEDVRRHLIGVGSEPLEYSEAERAVDEGLDEAGCVRDEHWR